MKKRFLAKIAFVLTLTTVVTGCGLSNSDAAKATEYVNDETENAGEYLSGDQAYASDGSSVIVADGLMEPALEEPAASASTSVVDAATAGSSDVAASSSSTGASKSDSQASAAATTATTEINSTNDGKTVMVFFGDSQFANGRSEGTDIPHLIGQRVPDSEVYNLAIGGTTAALELSTSEIDPAKFTSNCFLGMSYAYTGTADRNAVLADYPEILQTMNSIDPDRVDYYFIEYGANDFFNRIPLDPTQYDGNKIHTYYEALSQGISNLRKRSPNAKVILVTPFYGVYKDENTGAIIGDTYVVSNGIDTLANYARKAVNVVEDDNMVEFDTMFQTHCDLYIDTAEQYLMDGVHLTLTGRQIFARLMAHLPNWMEGFEPYAYLENDFIKISEFDPNENYRYRDDMLHEYYPEAYEKMMNGEYRLAKPQN
ncbi:SGNH/GDSL hydrolase family protein [Butyrivibrio sp. AE2015]|uniref:SGNH/GDSL hydrolase family protein n=1 Tax=Butyrivibrio sp. AE2015 TaxID=1280663 RepID=UPI0003B3C7DC|nr:SGNH/GDSL hydrolase family protein [Butyrivibrio sp. AE2015]